jgi:predicted dehydrogenase
MRFSLIGCNAESLQIVEAIARWGNHSVTSIYNADDQRRKLFELVPDARWEDHWESLLVAGESDAVIVAFHGDELTLEDQLRKLAQAAVPMIVAHPIHDSLFAYELEMMREEAGGVIVPFCAGIQHPALTKLSDLIRDPSSSAIGQPEQIVFERCLAERDRRSVLDAFAQDVTLIRSLIGDITSVNAVGGLSPDAPLANLSVNLTGHEELPARWSVGPAIDNRDATITLAGGLGRSVLTIRDSRRNWTLDSEGTTPESESFETYEDGAAVIETLERAIANQSPPAWEQICHDLEVAEQADRSLRRKRTIELRRESQNEEGNFKGLMSAGGCLILMLAFLLLLVFAVVDGFRTPLVDPDQPAPERAHLLLRMWPVYPLAAFLLLQLLLLVAKRPSKQTKDAD